MCLPFVAVGPPLKGGVVPIRNPTGTGWGPPLRPWPGSIASLTGTIVIDTADGTVKAVDTALGPVFLSSKGRGPILGNWPFSNTNPPTNAKVQLATGLRDGKFVEIVLRESGSYPPLQIESFESQLVVRFPVGSLVGYSGGPVTSEYYSIVTSESDWINNSLGRHRVQIRIETLAKAQGGSRGTLTQRKPGAPPNPPREFLIPPVNGPAKK